MEKLSDPNDRTAYLENRRILRGRPQAAGYSRRARYETSYSSDRTLSYFFRRRRMKLNGDLKAAAEQFGGLNDSDYGTQSFHIPYGPKFDSKKIEKIIYKTDLGKSFYTGLI